MKENRMTCKRSRMMLPVFILMLSMYMLLFAGRAQAAVGDNYSISVKGTYHYSKAYELLRKINTLRPTANAYVRDETLMKAAMQRAAELACSFNADIRPNMQDALEISNKVDSSDVLFGYTDADSAFSYMKTQSTMLDRMVATSYKSIGIGCFSTGNHYYWCILYSNWASSSVITHLDATLVTSIHVVESYGYLQGSIAGTNYKDPTSMSASLFVGKEVTVTPLWTDRSSLLPSASRPSIIEVEPSSFNWKSSKKSVATVSATGVIKGKRIGTCTITATPKIGSGKGISVTVTVKKNTMKCALKSSVYTWTGKAIYPEVVVKKDGQTLSRGADYSVTYKKNKAAGYGKVIVKGKGSIDGQTETLLFKIRPAKITHKLKATKKGNIKVTWKKNSQASGYEIQAATNKSMKANLIKLHTDADHTSAVLSSLLPKTVYYVRIREYKIVGGEYMFSKWSKKLKVTTKAAPAAEEPAAATS